MELAHVTYPEVRSVRVAENDEGHSRSLRRCARCGEAKPLSQFHNSVTGQFSYCADCRRAYDREYYATRGGVARRARQRQRDATTRAWGALMKLDVPCSDCGGVFPEWVMHWDHLPGHVKVGDVSTFLRSRSREEALQELSKCELVCANCHAIRTSQRRRRPRA